MMSSYTEKLPGGSLVLTCVIVFICSVVLSIGPVVSNRGGYTCTLCCIFLGYDLSFSQDYCDLFLAEL